MKTIHEDFECDPCVGDGKKNHRNLSTCAQLLFYFLIKRNGGLVHCS